MNERKEPRDTQINFRLSTKQREELRRYAWDSNTSISTVVRKILERDSVISPSVKDFA